MSRCIVNVATGPHYLKGQDRLRARLASPDVCIRSWRDCLPVGSPSHQDAPYAFKAFALEEARNQGYDTLLWCDASIIPGQRPLTDLWEKIEREGIWFSRNGYSNYEWTADAAYPDLFNVDEIPTREDGPSWLDEARDVNRQIEHVVAGAFGISLKHEIGRAFLAEYLRLAQTKAFCGPWINSNHGIPANPAYQNPARCRPCGPSDVRGHRHDQTAASMICWRLGVQLTNPPEWIAYKGRTHAESCLIMDGAY